MNEPIVSIGEISRRADQLAMKRMAYNWLRAELERDEAL